MNRIIFGFLILLAFPLTAFAERDVIFTATNQKFAVIPTATGKVSTSGPFISIALDHYTMRGQISNEKWPVKILQYKIGLAFQNASGAWEVVRWSDAANQNLVLLPGQTKLIENYRTVIPIDGLSSLKDFWLVLAVEVEIKGANGFTYAHSNKGLF